MNQGGFEIRRRSSGSAVAVGNGCHFSLALSPSSRSWIYLTGEGFARIGVVSP